MFRYMAMLLAGLAALVSCGDPADTDVEVVPDGVLKIFADKTSIAADGADCVTFRVMFGSEDVSTKNTMHIVKEYNGKTEDMAAGANVFSTIAAGTYRFKAYLYSGGEHISENENSIIGMNSLIPTGNDVFVHLFHIFKRSFLYTSRF